jgi:superfamily II DNA or RNA helicase
MELRPYQQTAVERVEREWGSGNSRTLLVQATGTGKTIVMAALAHRIASRGGRTLVLAHRGELLDQAADKIQAMTGLACSREQAEHTALGEWNSVTVGSVQTLMQDKRLKRFRPDRFSHVFVDEAHHAVSDSYRKVLDYFDQANVLGVTATADRADRRGLSEVFDSLAFEYGMADAIHDGWLCPIEARMIPLKLDISSVGIQSGDYAAGQPGDALEPYLDAIADEMAELCADRKTVAFLPLIRTADAFARKLNRRGLTAQHVSGQSADRTEILSDYQRGEFRVLCNSMLLTEGWDCPDVDCIVVLRPTKSRGLYAQMVGRGTRLAPGKEKLLLLDFLWMTGRHDLCRPATLLGASDEVERRVSEMVEEAMGDLIGLDLLDAEPQAEADVQEQRENKLAEELERMRHRKAQLVDPLQYALSICDIDLQTYEPEFSWESREPTEEQVKFLVKRGIDTSGMDAGMASRMIDTLVARQDAGMATPKQVRMLERKGFRHPGTWTFGQASKMMGILAGNRWMVPAWVDPETYVPEVSADGR